MGASVAIAPFASRVDVREDETRFLDLLQPGLSPVTLENQWYAGVRANADLAFQDDLTNPRHGFWWPSSFDLNIGINNAPDNFATIRSSWVAYLSARTRRQVTTAFRIGGAHNFGTFPFYGANTIGGEENVRGYRRERFSGRSSLYGNAELRVELLRAGGVMLPGAFGLTGFFDAGRVWTDDESSRVWHTGYGGGIWYDFAGELLLRLDVGFSEEETTVRFGPGFFF
jgi:outer membrane translocation and assembly module TamA